MWGRAASAVLRQRLQGGGLKRLGGQAGSLAVLGASGLAELPACLPAGKLLVLGALFALAAPTLTTAAILSVPSPFLRSSGRHCDPDCATSRRPLESPLGDPLTLLNIFDAWVQVSVSGCPASVSPPLPA